MHFDHGMRNSSLILPFLLLAAAPASTFADPPARPRISPAHLEVYSSVFIGNTSSADGGGLGTADAAVTVAGSLFVDNSAVDGSGFKANVSTVSLSNSTTLDNELGPRKRTKE